MRLTIKYLTLFLLCTFFTCAQAESFKLSYQTISASEIEKNPKYQNLKQFDSGHHQTIIKIHGLPEVESYVLKWERPLLIKSLGQREYTKEVFTRLKDFLGEDELLLVTSSRGFIPGEKVTWTLETQDGASISEKVEIAKVTQAKINETSELYRPAASRGALIYFLLSDLPKIHSFYKYSLESFIEVINRAIDKITQGI